jgi:hypothetical protein
MTFLPHPLHYSRDELHAMIHSVTIGAWIPKFATLHNTGVPNLKQYLVLVMDQPRRRSLPPTRPAMNAGWAGIPACIFSAAPPMSGTCAI